MIHIELNKSGNLSGIRTRLGPLSASVLLMCLEVADSMLIKQYNAFRKKHIGFLSHSHLHKLMKSHHENMGVLFNNLDRFCYQLKVLRHNMSPRSIDGSVKGIESCDKCEILKVSNTIKVISLV